MYKRQARRGRGIRDDVDTAIKVGEQVGQVVIGPAGAVEVGQAPQQLRQDLLVVAAELRRAVVGQHDPLRRVVVHIDHQRRDLLQALGLRAAPTVLTSDDPHPAFLDKDTAEETVPVDRLGDHVDVAAVRVVRVRFEVADRHEPVGLGNEGRHIDSGAGEGWLIVNDKQQPDWAKMQEQLRAGFAEVGKTLEQTGRIWVAQGSMGWAFRGDLEKLREALDAMSPELVAEVSAAAALLGSACDANLARRDV